VSNFVGKSVLDHHLSDYRIPIIAKNYIKRGISLSVLLRQQFLLAHRRQLGQSSTSSGDEWMQVLGC
jgi:hypothetical protein